MSKTHALTLDWSEDTSWHWKLSSMKTFGLGRSVAHHSCLCTPPSASTQAQARVPVPQNQLLWLKALRTAAHAQCALLRQGLGLCAGPEARGLHPRASQSVDCCRRRRAASSSALSDSAVTASRKVGREDVGAEPPPTSDSPEMIVVFKCAAPLSCFCMASARARYPPADNRIMRSKGNRIVVLADVFHQRALPAPRR